MKVVKSLLLCTAASLVAVPVARAADLPVKANPVEYVKICSVYGDGFFYIPGTDTCIKIGGWVRIDFYGGDAAGSAAPGIFNATSLGPNTSTYSANFFSTQTFVLSADTRSQTDYGTLRGYFRAGFRDQTNMYQNGVVYIERGFMQLGGFTAGKTASFYDFYNGAFSFNSPFLGGGSWSPFGILLAAYTFQFGTGVSATLSVEDGTMRRSFAWDASAAGLQKLSIGSVPGPNFTNENAYQTCGTNLVTNDLGTTVAQGCPIGDYAAQKMPDFVANLRVDQAWGSAQVMAAVHQVAVGPYGNDTLETASTAVPVVTYTGITPSNAYGFAVGGGILLNVPWNQGDKFWLEGSYTQGAVAYAGLEEQTAGNYQVVPLRFSGGGASAGWIPDTVYANTIGGAGINTLNPANQNLTGQHLTTAWTIGGAYEHYWTPTLRTALWGVITGVDFDSTAASLLCSTMNGGVTVVHGSGVTQNAPGAPAFAGCNPNINIWGIGLRTIWNPVKNLDVGFEIMYDELDNNMNPATVLYNFGGAGSRPAGTYTPENLGSWTGILRLQRNFYP